MRLEHNPTHVAQIRERQRPDCTPAELEVISGAIAASQRKQQKLADPHHREALVELLESRGCRIRLGGGICIELVEEVVVPEPPPLTRAQIRNVWRALA